MGFKDKRYTDHDQLICSVCETNNAISEDNPYCGLCGANSEGLFYAHQKMFDIQRQLSDLANGFQQRGLREVSLDIQSAIGYIDQAKKKLEANPLFLLDKVKRGIV